SGMLPSPSPAPRANQPPGSRSSWSIAAALNAPPKYCSTSALSAPPMISRGRAGPSADAITAGSPGTSVRGAVEDGDERTTGAPAAVGPTDVGPTASDA